MKNLVNYLDDYFDENYNEQLYQKKEKIKKISISEEKKFNGYIKSKKHKKEKYIK